MTDNAITVGLATIVVLGVGAQWLGRRLGFPSLLLLLPAGLVAGGVLGLVDPEELFGETLFPLVTLLVALLLFQSGLKLRVADLPRDARRPVVQLVTIGALVTFAGASIGTLTIVGVDHDLAFLIGAILVVSGPTVVGPLLEVVRPRSPTGSVLRWEGVVLDPIGATLGVVVLNLVLAAGRGGVHPALQMLGRLGLGVSIGAVAAAGLVFVMSRFLVTDDMEAAVALLFAVAAYGLAEILLSEAGLFAAVTLGVAAANQRVVPTARISGFGETLEVLIIGILFILLGALIDVDALTGVVWRGLVLVLVLVLVVRPLASVLSLAGTSLPWRDRALVAWVDPRGIVAAATAAQFTGTLTAAGVDASVVSPLVFAVILGTGLVYGLTARPVARRLGVCEPPPTGVGLVGHAPWLHELARLLHELGATVLLLTTTPVAERVEVPGVEVVSIHESEERVDRALREASLGQALVATEPGALLTLVVADLIESLGRRNVYRVPARRDGAVERLVSEAWSPQPFAPPVALEEVERRAHAGATVQVVRGDEPDGAVVLAALHADGSVDLAPGATRSGLLTRRRAPETVATIALVG